MEESASNVKRLSLVKPTVDTPFHIDFSWWSQHDREWRVYLRSLLCTEHREALAEKDEDQLVDWVDPETAEVQQVDGLQYALISHCSQQEGFLDEHTAIVEAAFRLLLKNGNTPMSSAEFAVLLKRPPRTILQTLSGRRVYRGLRPILEGE